MPNGNAIEEYEVLVNLSHVAHVRNYRHAEFPRHQAYRDELADTTKPCTVWLKKSHAPGLQIVLEHNAIRHVFSQRDGKCGDCLCENLMAEHVIRMSRFLNPQ